MNKYFKNFTPPVQYDRYSEMIDLVKSSMEKFKVGAYNNALTDVNKACVLDTNCFEAHYQKSLCCSALKDYKTAYDEINITLKLNPECIPALMERGNLHQIFKDDMSALLDYTKVIELDSEFYDAYYNRGFIYLANENYESAINDFEAVVKGRPYDADAYNNLGLSYYQKGEVTKGITFLHKSAELDPNSDAVKNLEAISSILTQQKKEKSEGK